MSKTSRKRRKHGAAQGRRTPQTRTPQMRMPQNQVKTQPARDEDPYQALKDATRLRLRLIWEMAQIGGPLNDEDARTVQMMREHPEYADLWPRLDAVSDAELEREGANPILHITIHTTLENQLAANDPPVTGEVLTALMAQGLSRHEAMHRMGAVLAELISNVMKNNRAFDEAWFERELRALV